MMHSYLSVVVQLDRKTYYQLIAFVLFLFTARIHFFQIPGSTSDLRLDIITMCFFGMVYAFFNINDFVIKRKRALFWLVIIVLSYTSLVFTVVSKNIIYALFQIFWYTTMLFAFFLAKKLVTNLSLDGSIYPVRLFVNISALMHLIETVSWRIFENERIKDLAYGFFEIPSPFALVLGCYAILIFSGKFNVSKFEKAILMAALLFSESRIGTGAFFISMILFSRHRYTFLLAAIFIYISLFFVESYFKAVSFLTLTPEKILQDPSFLMRVDNMESMFRWWDSSGTLLFGGGVLSHLEYSVFFHRPGPLDSFYLKMLSDFGLISLTLFLIVGVVLLIGNFHIIKRDYKLVLTPILFVSIYSVFNEGLLSVKAGHIVFFLIGICFWHLVTDKRYCDMSK